ncbi:type II toxin-antitoxin system RelE/ParE family toxin [Terriglobus sp. RCC_193]|uniref:type II toxin-antitoxin system RelE/ParE family toxin n=1 Tax=Terriglobus sp. RCC_193 TaxID=3239218 RepID=UPI0035245930
MSVTLTEFAQDTLVAAYNFVYDSNPQNAELVLDRIYGILRLLRDRKFMGERGPIPGTRRYLVPKTSIFVVYRDVGDDVQILAFLHKSQRWPHIPVP